MKCQSQRNFYWLGTSTVVILFLLSHYKGKCKNYMGITLLSTLGKIIARVLGKRIRSKVKSPFQYGFTRYRSTIDTIFIMYQISKKILAQYKELHVCTIDLK